ncbi:hypothetical protein HDU76_000398, partial [Blyttiomyces sp. JEL0837]
AITSLTFTIYSWSNLISTTPSTVPIVPSHLTTLKTQSIFLLLTELSKTWLGTNVPDITNPLIILSSIISTALIVAFICLIMYQISVIQTQLDQQKDDAVKAVGGIVECREKGSGFWGGLYFTWMNPLMRLGDQRPLTAKDVPDLAENDKAETAVRKFQEVKARGYKSLFAVIMVNYMGELLYSMLCGFISACLSLSGPFFLYQITGFIHNPANRPVYEVFLYVFLLGFCSILRALADNQAFHTGRHLSIRIKASLVHEIYTKSLRRVMISSALDKKGSDGNEAKKDDNTKKDEKKGKDGETNNKKEDGKADQKKAEEKKDEKDTDDATVGKIVTLMSSDAEKIRDILPYMYDVINFPIQIMFSIAALMFVVGWPALAGLAVMVLTLPATYYISHYTNEVFDKLMDRADKRTNIVNEALQGIRIIKYFAWEQNFLKKINNARKEELKTLIQYYIQGALNTFVWLIAPLLVSFCTLYTLTVIAGREMDAQLAFTCLSLFNSLRIPLVALPDVILEVFQLRIAFERIEKFLAQEELEKYSNKSATVNPIDDSNTTVGFRSAWFQWTTESSARSQARKDAEAAAAAKAPVSTERTPLLGKQTSTATLNDIDSQLTNAVFTLKDININFPKFGLTAICGATGAGKSSLIQALLGEMKRISGSAFLPDPRFAKPLNNHDGPNTLTTGVAYVAQTSWLMNASIRDNILFGDAYDPIRYDRVIKACALVKDLETLEAGDLTEIGEKGINLSGGQKQRVSLARAVYSKASIVLLDDPLSAVDAPTAKHLFDFAICGLLNGRTRILVTHATHVVLPKADHVVVMNSGEVLASGSVDYVMKVPGVKEVIAHDNAAALISSKEEDHTIEETADGIQPILRESSMQDLLLALHGGDSGHVTKPLKDYANGKTLEDAKKLVEDEVKQTGAVKLMVYLKYISSAGGILFVLGLLFFTFLDRGTMIANDYWLKTWAEAYNTSDPESFGVMSDGNGLDISRPSPLMLFGTSNPLTGIVGVSSVVLNWIRTSYGAFNEKHYSVLKSRFGFGAFGSDGDGEADEGKKETVDTLFYVSVYAMISGFWVLVFLSTYTVRSVGSYLASIKYHEGLLNRILYAPMRFFDTTPIGRILNRASKDISVMDKNVMQSFETYFACFMDSFSVFVVVITITPIFLVTVFPVMFIYVFVSKRYLAASRELKRLDSVSRSPIYSMFSETLTGASTIRAYGTEDRFMKENLRRVDYNHRMYFYLWCSNRWLGVRISSIAALIIFLAALSTVAARNFIGAGLAAMSLTWALTLSDVLIWTVRVHANMEMNMNAIERIEEYLELEQEAPAIIPAMRPVPSWPSKGSIAIENLEMRYAPDLPPVLTNVSFTIKGGEKVGIVGRTGAGKSSLSLSLFRIVEPTQGRITIDGIDISTIGLYNLRSRLTIIPQDPVLFAGTIRSNLDPFSEYDDDKIWTALRKVRFLESLQQQASNETSSLTRSDSTDTLIAINESSSSTSSGYVDARTGLSLDASVSEGGSNYSQGQRQLLCLARALLKSSRVTVFDEATASVDKETDARIQDTIRGPEFANTTVLSIAHRLRTIADYDKVIVLERGAVDQIGTPYELMQVPGRFKKMCEESGDFDELLEMAKKASLRSAN